MIAWISSITSWIRNSLDLFHNWYTECSLLHFLFNLFRWLSGSKVNQFQAILEVWLERGISLYQCIEKASLVLVSGADGWQKRL